MLNENLNSEEKFLLNSLKQIHHIDGIRALLDWDQQVLLPIDAANSRADQLETIALIRYVRFTDIKLVDTAKNVLSKTKNDDIKIVAQNYIKLVEREIKLPAEFVARRAKIQAECFQLWQHAKETDSFDSVKSKFKDLLDIYKQEAQLVGFQEHQYDALLDQYEPDGRVSWILPLLESVCDRLGTIIESRIHSQNSLKKPILNLNKEAQFKVCKKIIFDFGLLENFSRLDSSSHPFCTTISSDDVRITTRFDEQDLLSAVSSTMHELGHALYERNLPKQWRGTALGEVYSLGLHESQSRIIENCIGRSKHFQEYLSKILFDFGGVKYSSEYLYNATNWVEKSFIRVDADEVTYSLHVLIRLKLEILLLNNELSVDDLPSVWNQMYSKYLNITPSSNKVGVLQDVHWYSGAFGYFSTYVLGNIYNGAMLYKLNQDIPNYLLDLENGNFSKVTSWLKSNVHDHGSKYSPRELLGRILNVRNPKNYIPTGNEFINYLESK